VATPQMYNPQDASGVIQAAIKNLASNNVFYFSIPVSLEVVFAAGATMDVAALATAWKSIEESQEASVLVNGTFLNCELVVCARRHIRARSLCSVRNDAVLRLFV
jgi:hypothetical protein